MQLIIHGNRMQEVEGVTAEYPYVLNRVDSSHIRVPWHWHEEVEFSLVKKGRLLVTVSGRQYEFGEGEGFFLNANVLHAMQPAEPQINVVWDSHMVHPMLLGGSYKSVFDMKYMAPVLKNKKFELAEFRRGSAGQEEILRLLERVSDEQGGEFCEFRTRCTFSEIWLLLMKELQYLENNAKLQKPVSQERIQIMLQYIHSHYAEKLTLDMIAASALVSKRECLRCFRSCIGKTPFEYLLDYRIQAAESLLGSTSLPVTEIAMRTGFSGSAYFAKTFKELRGVSPTQYRKGL